MEFSEQVKQHSQQYQELLKNIKNPKNIRILQRDLVYLVGIPQELADEQILIRPEFLGQYGKIDKISVGNAYPKKKKQLQKFQSSHVKFANKEEACIAVLCLNGLQIDDYQLKASFGFSRYCHEFLQDKECQDKDCNYIHYWSNPEDCCSSSNKLYNKKLRAFEKEDIVNYLLKRNFDFEKNFQNSTTNKFSLFPKSECLKDLVIKQTNKQNDNTNNTTSVSSIDDLSINSSEKSFENNNKTESLQLQLQNPAIRQIQLNSANCLNKSNQLNFHKKTLINSKSEFFFEQKQFQNDSISTYFSNEQIIKKKQSKKLLKKYKQKQLVKENQKKKKLTKNQGTCQKQYQTNLQVPQHYNYQTYPLQQNRNCFYPDNSFVWQLCNHQCKCQSNDQFNLYFQNRMCRYQDNTNQVYNTHY